MKKDRNWLVSTVLTVLIVLTVLAAGSVSFGANECDAGEEPDVIVGAIFDKQRYGTQGGATGFAIGTESCNVGTCELDWLSGTPFHPVIAQNMFRLHEGRFTQIGVGWLKHGFATLNDDLCGTCIPDDGQHLGVNCSDPYWAGLNGSQTSLGPRFEINAAAGTHLHPYTYQGQTGSNPNYKRISVLVSDLDPDLNPGAQYFVEAQYVTKDDAEAGNNQNNNSYRRIIPNSAGTDFSLTGPTFQEEPALFAWDEFGTGTVDWIDGRLVGGFEVVDMGDGFWRYEYAIENVISDRSVMALRIPMPHGANVRDIGFADADYHSGEPYDGTDWAIIHEDGPSVTNYVEWSTDTFAANADANAIRWGTVYSFWFEIDVPPVGASGPGISQPMPSEIFYFKTGSPPMITWETKTPERCGDSFCDADESALDCSADCSAVLSSGEILGAPLTVRLDQNADVVLDWDESCSTFDDDYGIYEGFIGDYQSHSMRSCSTGGATTTTFTPSPDSTYYLVVPNSFSSEGSYGSDSLGNPRPTGLTVCRQQQVEACQ